MCDDTTDGCISIDLRIKLITATLFLHITLTQDNYGTIWRVKEDGESTRLILF